MPNASRNRMVGMNDGRQLQYLVIEQNDDGANEFTNPISFAANDDYCDEDENRWKKVKRERGLPIRAANRKINSTERKSNILTSQTQFIKTCLWSLAIFRNDLSFSVYICLNVFLLALQPFSHSLLIAITIAIAVAQVFCRFLRLGITY